MPTENPRITFTLTEEMRLQIEAYKFDHRLKNQTQAIVSLLERGFQALSGQDFPNSAPSDGDDSFTPEEKQLLAIFRTLNETGREAALGSLRGIASLPDMTKEDSVSETA